MPYVWFFIPQPDNIWSCRPHTYTKPVYMLHYVCLLILSLVPNYMACHGDRGSTVRETCVEFLRGGIRSGYRSWSNGNTRITESNTLLLCRHTTKTIKLKVQVVQMLLFLPFQASVDVHAFSTDYAIPHPKSVYHTVKKGKAVYSC